MEYKTVDMILEQYERILEEKKKKKREDSTSCREENRVLEVHR